MVKSKIMIFVLLIVGNVTTVFGAQGSLDQRVSELSQQIATKMSAKQKTTIAIIEFTDLQGRVTDFGRFLAEELITRLYDTEKFKVIERQQLNKVIAEQKLSLTGVVDPASAKQLGKLLGVDAIASGTYTDLSQSLKVNARLISTATGEIFAVASTEIFKDESVMRLLAAAPPAFGNDSLGANKTLSPAGGNSKAPQNVTANGFTIHLVSCRMSGGGVECQFTVVNDSSADKRFLVYAVGAGGATSRLFDNFGNEYVAAETAVGSDAGTYGGSTVLVPQVMTKGSIRFDKINNEATIITLLRFSCYSIDERYGGQNWQADFRNITISK